MPHNVVPPPVIDLPKPNSPKKNGRHLEDLNIAINEDGGNKEDDDDLEMPVPDQTDRKELLQQLEEQKVGCHGNMVQCTWLRNTTPRPAMHGVDSTCVFRNRLGFCSYVSCEFLCQPRVKVLVME